LSTDSDNSKGRHRLNIKQERKQSCEEILNPPAKEKLYVIFLETFPSWASKPGPGNLHAPLKGEDI